MINYNIIRNGFKKLSIKIIIKQFGLVQRIKFETIFKLYLLWNSSTICSSPNMRPKPFYD